MQDIGLVHRTYDEILARCAGNFQVMLELFEVNLPFFSFVGGWGAVIS